MSLVRSTAQTTISEVRRAQFVGGKRDQSAGGVVHTDLHCASPTPADPGTAGNMVMEGISKSVLAVYQTFVRGTPEILMGDTLLIDDTLYTVKSVAVWRQTRTSVLAIIMERIST